MTKAVFSVLSALLLGFSATADDKKDEKIDGKKIVGRWRPKDDIAFVRIKDKK